MIVDGAARFFAKKGFSANTRELAQFIGISPALIFKHFGTKQNLIDRVYDHVYLSRWRDDWGDLIRDRSLPLRDRLVQFYRGYFALMDDFEWIRCGLFSSLEGGELAGRYFESRITPILELMASELRKERREEPAAGPPTEEEMEDIWHLHSSFVYYAVRKNVHGRPVWQDKEAMIVRIIDLYFSGAAEKAQG